MIKDSGARLEFDTGAVRDIKEGKGRVDLVPAVAILRLSKHFEEGAKKYGEYNWQKGIPIHSYIDSALRHLFKYLDGRTDEDHLCAATWNLMCAMWTEEKKPEMQDIPTRVKYLCDTCGYYGGDLVGCCNADRETFDKLKCNEECEHYKPCK